MLISCGKSTVKHQHEWRSPANQRILFICCFKDVCVCAFTHLLLDFVRSVFRPQRVSELLLLQHVKEVQESGVGLAVFSVGEAHGCLGSFVLILADEDLHLVELAHDELDCLGGAYLEGLDAIFFAVRLKVSASLLQESLDHRHDRFLGVALKLLELMSVNDIDDSLTLPVVSLIIS